MKTIGIAFITVGAALLLYVAFSYFSAGNQLHSPIPDEKGVKVIFVTPGS